MSDIVIRNSWRKGKKYVAVVDGEPVHFGQKGASDYTMHKDSKRQQRYIQRHAKLEENYWHASIGLKTPSFWSRWLLWSEPSMDKALKTVSVLTERKVYFA